MNELTFDPTLPYAVTPLWPGDWGRVRLIFDIYAACRFADDEQIFMAEFRAPGRALNAATRAALLARIEAVDAANTHNQTMKTTVTAETIARSGELEAAMDAATDAHEAAQQAQRNHTRARLLAEIGHYVLRVEWPDGTEGAGGDSATWARFPLALLEWITGEGVAAARAALWAPPIPKAESASPPA